jgi:hypothetical protein
MESKVCEHLLFPGKQQALMGGLVGKRTALVRRLSSFMKNLDLNFSVFGFGLDYEGGNMRLLVIMIPLSKGKTIIMKLTLFWRSL